MVHWLNGGDSKPTKVPPRPFERGVAGRPTLVDNVETLAHLALITRFGSTWWRSIGYQRGPGIVPHDRHRRVEESGRLRGALRAPPAHAPRPRRGPGRTGRADRRLLRDLARPRGRPLGHAEPQRTGGGGRVARMRGRRRAARGRVPPHGAGSGDAMARGRVRGAVRAVHVRAPGDRRRRRGARRRRAAEGVARRGSADGCRWSTSVAAASCPTVWSGSSPAGCRSSPTTSPSTSATPAVTRAPRPSCRCPFAQGRGDDLPARARSDRLRRPRHLRRAVPRGHPPRRLGLPDPRAR